MSMQDKLTKNTGRNLLIILTIINIVVLILNYNKDVILIDKNKQYTYNISDDFYNKNISFFNELKKFREPK